MNRTILFFTALLFAVSVFGQEKEKVKPSFLFNEFSISLNRTNVSASGGENRLGCGAGMYRSFVLVGQLDFVFGMEYNYTSLFVKEIFYGQAGYEKDMAFRIHTASFPLDLRFSMGKRTKFFIESGIFLDIPVASQKKGDKRVSKIPSPSYPWIPWTIVKVKERAVISEINCGPSFGMGIRIPMKRLEWIVKADYKMGLNTLHTNGYDFHHHYYRLSVGMRITPFFRLPSL